jgi:hypothetical protein
MSEKLHLLLKIIKNHKKKSLFLALIAAIAIAYKTRPQTLTELISFLLTMSMKNLNKRNIANSI